MLLASVAIARKRQAMEINAGFRENCYGTIAATLCNQPQRTFKEKLQRTLNDGRTQSAQAKLAAATFQNTNNSHGDNAKLTCASEEKSREVCLLKL
jgi:23S rRNA A1618 N6-methylase RlmF